MEYFEKLLDLGWQQSEYSAGESSFVQASYTNDKYTDEKMVPTDMALRWSEESTDVMYRFLQDEALFHATFSQAFLKIVNADLPPTGSASDCFNLADMQALL